jgi:hypothetical protein
MDRCQQFLGMRCKVWRKRVCCVWRDSACPGLHTKCTLDRIEPLSPGCRHLIFCSHEIMLQSLYAHGSTGICPPPGEMGIVSSTVQPSSSLSLLCLIARSFRHCGCIRLCYAYVFALLAILKGVSILSLFVQTPLDYVVPYERRP